MHWSEIENWTKSIEVCRSTSLCSRSTKLGYAAGAIWRLGRVECWWRYSFDELRCQRQWSDGKERRLICYIVVFLRWTQNQRMASSTEGRRTLAEEFRHWSVWHALGTPSCCSRRPNWHRSKRARWGKRQQPSRRYQFQCRSSFWLQK